MMSLNISSLTIMADYVVPAVLRQLGILKLSPTLASTIETRGEIGPGTEEDVELQACSIHAVEKMRELMSVKSGRQEPIIRTCHGIMCLMLCMETRTSQLLSLILIWV